MNSRMGFVASLFGPTLACARARKKQGFFRGFAKQNFVTLLALQSKVKGAEFWLCQNRKLCEFSPLGGFASETLISRGNSRNTDAYILQELLNGSYQIKKGLKYD